MSLACIVHELNTIRTNFAALCLAWSQGDTGHWAGIWHWHGTDMASMPLRFGRFQVVDI